jgi:hypothetical protein
VGGITYTYVAATGAWRTSKFDSGIDSLNDVDTSTSAPTTGQLLQWNGTNWAPYTHTNGITEIDQWRITADLSANTNPISANLERVDDASFSKIGTGMSVSSGIWTFPVTGLYEVSTQALFYNTATDGFMSLTTSVSTDGGANWDTTNEAVTHYTGKWGQMMGTGCNYVNVTDAANVKVKFTLDNMVSGNVLKGATNHNRTAFTFKRIGDSQ